MHAQRDKDSIRVSLGHFEGHILRQILAFIRREYQKKTSELDHQTANAWYNLGGTGHMSPEEQADWLQQMHEMKGSRLSLLEKWTAALSVQSEGQPLELTLSLAETP